MTDLTREGLVELADRVEALKTSDNAVDVLCEIALFRPSTTWASIRANHAGTKVILTDQNGRDATFRADDWTHEVLGGPRVRAQTAASLRARAMEAGRG
ncbi:hypothetical protein [Sphingomonas sp. DC1100-1]|uniref:hypothetical protein n=1 Tax=unclassified Sphingomonas TaxID=196159 RepID=UPI003CEB7B91